MAADLASKPSTSRETTNSENRGYRTFENKNNETLPLVGLLRKSTEGFETSSTATTNLPLLKRQASRMIIAYLQALNCFQLEHLQRLFNKLKGEVFSRVCHNRVTFSKTEPREKHHSPPYVGETARRTAQHSRASTERLGSIACP